MLEGKLSDEIDLTELVKFVPFTEQEFGLFKGNPFHSTIENFNET